MLELVSVGTISKFNKRLLILFLMDIGNASIYPFLFWLHPPLAFFLIMYCSCSLNVQRMFVLLLPILVLSQSMWCKHAKYASTHAGSIGIRIGYDWWPEPQFHLPYWITIIPYRRQESSPTLYNNTITINILSQFNIFCQRAKFLTSPRLTAMQIFQWNCSPWFIS